VVEMGASTPAETFNVDVPEPPLIVAGANDAPTPAGKPDTDKVTGEVKPLPGVTVIVERAEPALVTVIEEGEALRLKLPVGVVVTIKVTPVVCVMPPPTPETVIG